MNSENGIGKLELICIVFNSAIYKLFIGKPEIYTLYGGSAAWLCALFCGIVFLAVLYILLRIYTPYSQIGLTAALKQRSKPLSAFVSATAAVLFLLSFLQTLSMAYSALRSVRYSNSPMWFVLLFLISASAAAAFFGRRAVLRMHSLFTIGIACAVVFILLLNLRLSDIYNIAPILGNGAHSVFIRGLRAVVMYSGIAVIFFVPTNQISYSFRKTVMLSAAAAVLLNVLFALVFSLGFCPDYAKTISLPLFSLAKSASLGSLSARPDLLYLSALISSSVLYLSLLMRIISTNLRQCISRKKKKSAAVLLCLLLTLSLCGCSDGSEIETNAYIVALGVDSADDGYQYTFQISNPLGSGGSMDTEENAADDSDDNKSDENKTVDNVFINAADFYSAADKLQSVLSKNINLSHMKLAVFSENVASSRIQSADKGAMPEHCRILMKEREMRPSVYLCLADSAREYLTRVNPTLEKNAVSYYELFFGNSRVPFAPITQIQGFLNDCADRSSAAVVPTVTEDGLCGMGIFNGEILADTFDSNAAMAYKILCGDLFGAAIKCSDGTAVISVKKRPRLNAELSGNSLTVKIKIHPDIQNQNSNAEVHSVIAGMTEQLLNRSYSQGCDILGIEKRLKRHFLTAEAFDAANIRPIVNNCKFLIYFD